MDFIIFAWSLINSNSGAIQVVIAVVALILAICGYWAVRKQIQISYDQEKKSQDLRRFEIKQAILKTRVDYLNISLDIQKELPEAYRMLFEKLFETKKDIYQLNINLLSTYESKQILVDKYYQLLIEMFKKDDFYLKGVEKLYFDYMTQVSELIIIKSKIIECKKIN